MEPEKESFSRIFQEVLSKNWKTVKLLCKSTYTELLKINSKEEITDFIRFLFVHACAFCKELKIKEGVLLRKIIEKLKPDIPQSTYIKSSYEFLNYYSCALRDTGLLSKAKIVAKKALSLAKKHPALEISDSYMNTCAILSALGNHLKATHYAKLALEAIKKELSSIKLKQDTQKITEKYTKISIANFNLAVEEEFSNNIFAALIYYENCLRVLERNEICEPKLEEKVKECIKRLKNEKKIMKKKETEFRTRSQMKIRGNSKLCTPDVRNNKVTSRQSMRKKDETFDVKEINRAETAFATFDIPNKPSISKPLRKVFRYSEKVLINKEKISKSVNNVTASFDKRPNSSGMKNLGIIHVRPKIGKLNGTKNKSEIIRVQTKETALKTESDTKSNLPKINQMFLGHVIKIQSFFRGFLARLKFKWLKRRNPQGSFKRFKLIKNEIFLVKISNSDISTDISVKSKDKSYSLSLKENFEFSEIFERINIENDDLVFCQKQYRLKHVLTSEIQLRDIVYTAEYSVLGKKLIIILKSAISELKKEIIIENEYNKALNLFIVEKIQPKLKVINSCIVLSEFENSKKGIIQLNSSPVLINLVQSEASIDYYIDSKLIFSLPIETIPDILPLLYLKSSNDKSSSSTIYKKRSENKIKLIFKEKMLLGNRYEYFVSVYSVLDKSIWYYFSAEFEGSPELVGVSYMKNDLKKMFGVNVIENQISSISKKLVVINGTLDLSSAVYNSQKLDAGIEIDKLVSKIQAAYRGNRTRDILKLQRCENEVLISSFKIMEGSPVGVRLFRMGSSYLAEIIKQSKAFYFFIKDPLFFVTIFYKFSHAELLLHLIRIEEVPYIISMEGKKLRFTESRYFIEESSATVKVLHKVEEKLVNIAFLLPNKSIIIKAFDYHNQIIYVKRFHLSEIIEIIGKFDFESFISSIRIVNESISHSMTVLIKSKSSVSSIYDKVIYRTCIKIIETLYQVSVYIEKENLKFVYKRGSCIEIGLVFVIPLKLAYERSGFGESYLIPMINFFIKYLLVLRDDEVVLGSSHEKVNIEKCALKIQSAYKSFKTRKQMEGIISMTLVLKAKKTVNEKAFAILLYEKPNEHILFGVYSSEVYRKVIPKSRGDYAENIIRTNLDALFMTNSKSPKNYKQSLKFAQNIKDLLSSQTIAKLIVWEGNGFIGSKAVSVSILNSSTFETIECKVENQVSSFEISSGFLPRSSKVFKKLELSDDFKVSLIIPQSKTVFFIDKKISGHPCKIYLQTKQKKFLIIVCMVKEKKYFIEKVGKKADMMNLIRCFSIRKNSGCFSLIIN